MKRKIIFALLTLCFLNIAVFAQTNEQEILVQGNPPLTRETITKSADFFQWVLGGNLSAEENNAYRQYLVRIWQEKDAQSIKTIGEIVEMRDKLVTQTPEKLKSLNQQIRDSLLREMRSQPEDALSKILLKSYDRIQNSDLKQGGNSPAPRVPANNIDVQAFIGEWEENHVGNTDYDTGTGGSYRGRDHTKNIIRFFPDGTYRSAYVTQSEGFGCKANIYYGGTGSFRFEGNVLHLNEKTRRVISRNNCSPQDNYDKEIKAGNYSYPWQIGQDENGVKIVLEVNGKPHSFYKVQGNGFLGGN